jgi:hypothetical protein
MPTVNIWAVLVAAAASFLLGGLWYSHKVFGAIWNREAGRGPEAHQPHPAKVFGLSFVFAVINAFAFAVWLGSEPALGPAVNSGLIAGAGFVAASMGITYQFANLSLVMWVIDGGYHIARFALYGLILGLWH